MSEIPSQIQSVINVPGRPNLNPKTFGVFWDVLYMMANGLPDAPGADLLAVFQTQLFLYAALLPCASCRQNWVNTLSTDQNWASVSTRADVVAWLKSVHQKTKTHSDSAAPGPDWFVWLGVAIAGVVVIYLVTRGASS